MKSMKYLWKQNNKKSSCRDAFFTFTTCPTHFYRQIEVLFCLRADNTLIMGQVRFFRGTQLNLNAFFLEILNFRLDITQTISILFNIELDCRGIWFLDGIIYVYTLFLFQGKNRVRWLVTGYTHILCPEVKGWWSWTVHYTRRLQNECVVVLFLRVVFCEILCLDIPHHLFRVSKDCVIFTLVTLEILIELSATFTAQGFYVKVGSFRIVTGNALCCNRVGFVWGAFYCSVARRCCTVIFYFFRICNF